MSLRKSKGNMYPWVSHTHSHLGGECPHKCTYCYVASNRFGRPAKYQGPIRILEEELDTNYGKGNTIFVDNCNDLFAAEVPSDWIKAVLIHCHQYPYNRYVFQTKNPARYLEFIDLLPEDCLLGCTIETNRLTATQISQAPVPYERVLAMIALPAGVKRFITLEPIMDLDVPVIIEWLGYIIPEFVNIGADSQRHNLAEPSAGTINELIAGISGAGIEIREKHNLNRILQGAST